MKISSLTQSVLNFLRIEIITGVLAPGQKLNETQLSSRFGISRPPLREAFRLLEHDRLVVSIPRKGTYVKQISMQDLQEIYQARQMIECYAIDLLKAKNIRELPKVASALIEAYGLSKPSRQNLKELLVSRDIFACYHVKLVESAGNSQITNFYEAISSNLARYEYLLFSIPHRWKRSLEDHQEILNLIKMGAYDEAKERLRVHIDFIAEFQKRILRRKTHQEK